MDLNERVLQLQLINALTAADTDKTLSTILQINNASHELTYGSPLHLVVTLSSLQLVKQVLGVFCDPNSSNDWVNSTNDSLETPLHLASKLQRADVVEALFQVSTINDTLRQAQGLTAAELSTSEAVSEVFENQKKEFCGLLTQALKIAITSNDHSRLDALFESSARARAYVTESWLDINAPLHITANKDWGFLHHAAYLDNLELCIWGLKYGADVECIDHRGRKPIQVAKGEKVINTLKHAKSWAPIISQSLQQATHAIEAPVIHEAPILKGTLLKYTNLKDGYQPRYFVLQNQLLSYYISTATDGEVIIKDGIVTIPGKTPMQCRGTMDTSNITTSFASGDPTRFVVSDGVTKYHLKARSQVEAKQWVWGLMESRGLKKTSIAGVRPVVIASSSNNSPKGDFSQVDTEELGGKLAILEVNEKDEEQDKTEKMNDLFSYVQKHGGQGFENPELKRLLVLLRTEMEAQRDAVAVASKVVSEITNETSVDEETKLTHKNSDLLQLPNLLEDSSLQIEALIYGIVKTMNKREKFLESRVADLQVQLTRITGVLDSLENATKAKLEEPIKEPVANLSLSMPRTISHSSRYINSDSELDSEDEFFDAIDTDFSTTKSSHGDVQADLVLEPPMQLHDFPSVQVIDEISKDYLPIWPPRNQLPLDPTKRMPTLAVWSFLKSAIGKDLSKITLPVLFNEPISMLQRFCEDVEYVELLTVASVIGLNANADPAAEPILVEYCDYNKVDRKLLERDGEDSSLIRLAYITAFAISNYSSTVNRTSKPFNPMLGETYEIVHPVKKFRYIAEQVAHHPPISACYCDSPWYQFWAEVNVKSKFWGKSLEALPMGVNNIKLKTKAGVEHYSWRKVTTCVSNLILGTLTIDHYGDLEVTNHTTGEVCLVTFKPRDAGGWFGGSDDPVSFGKLVGVLRDARGSVKFDISGGWNTHFEIIPKSGTRITKPLTIWKAAARPPASLKNFHFTSFSMYLNQNNETLLRKLPGSDSRLRGDQLAMERGEWDAADKLKGILEVAQRTRRKELVEGFEASGIPNGPQFRGIEFGERWWQPRWFYRERDELTGEETWKFNGEYWNCRQNGWPSYVFNLFEVEGE